MRIGIDVSQVVYEGTGVARFVRHMVSSIVSADTEHEYILFGSAWHRKAELVGFIREMHERNARVTGVILNLPPKVLDFLWNRLHILSVERLVGHVDVFWSSDWTQPPLSKALGVTTIHDLSVFRYPESFPREILSVQRRRLKRAVAECSIFFCDSDATRHDAVRILHIPEEKTVTVYPGFRI